VSGGPVLVTGAAGFVGRHVVEALAAAGAPVRMLLRRRAALPAPSGAEVAVAELGDRAAVAEALRGCRAVVHLAARVHVMDDRAADPLAEFRRVNVEGTALLAREAARAGVRRLVLASTVKVNGESTAPGAPFRESDPPAPQDPYGRSKAEAEAALREVAAETGLEAVIVRPPLVYGAGVRANFLRLMELVDRGVPLPLGALRNRRDLVFVRNLADALRACVEHRGAAGQTFLVSDGEPVSSAELVRRIAAALGRPARLVPVPPSLLRALGAAAGRRGAVDRLLGSLEVDGGRIRDALGWTPPWTMEAGLAETAAAYRASAGEKR
jgi:nucleoside-diphosphate-sugar epimerase